MAIILHWEIFQVYYTLLTDNRIPAGCRIDSEFFDEEFFEDDEDEEKMLFFE